MAKTIDQIDSACLKKIIRNAKLPQPPADSAYQPTCVFMLLFGEDEPRILAIQKSDNEGYPWRNQVALPGGHVELKDAGPVDAAYRELEEELNITRNQVDFIGSMGHFQTINHKDIQVFIGLWNQEGPVRFDTDEIARVLDVPLKALVKTHIMAGFHGISPPTDALEYPLKDVVIWGVTARILHHFIELLYPFIDKGQYLI
jgi:8-oxo-dGTP pyrophosphatase MutT (NUDIX family)